MSSDPGTITGSVTSKGAPLPGAMITAREQHPAQKFIAVADARGNYRLAPIPPGRYDLECSLPGMVTVHRSGIELKSDEVWTVDFEMVSANDQ